MTKVCARLLLGLGPDVRIYALSLGGSPPGEQTLLCPSVVAIQAGRLYFGFEAERRRQSADVVFGHLKVCVACEVENQGRCLPGCQSLSQARRTCDGVFRLTWGQDRVGLRAQEVTALFLAWVMKQARSTLPWALKGPDPAEFSYNVGVPLDQLRPASPLRDAYRRMTFEGWRLSESVDQGLPLDQALAWIEKLREEEVPSEAVCKVQLCSELGAALVAFVTSPTIGPGIYGLVDIGAWTTEMSFFELTSSNGDWPKVSHYSGDTFRVGVTDVNERALRAVCELWDLLPLPLGADPEVRTAIREISAQREAGRFGMDRLSIDRALTRLPTESTLQFARDCVGERVRDNFRRAIVKASEKEKWPSAWRGFPIYVIGGGRRETALWKRLKETNALVGVVAPLPENQDVDDLPKSLADRFVIAAGLAIPVPLWHEARLPDQVKPYWAPRARRLLDSEELGYVEP
jgi:hypothetical protein